MPAMAASTAKAVIPKNANSSRARTPGFHALRALRPVLSAANPAMVDRHLLQFVC